MVRHRDTADMILQNPARGKRRGKRGGEEGRKLVQTLNFVVDGDMLQIRKPVWIEPAAGNARIHAALHVTGQGIANDQVFLLPIGRKAAEDHIKEAGVRLFEAQVFRDKDMIEDVIQSGFFELSLLREPGAVCDSTLDIFTLQLG